jgi:hypothetical protein
MAMCRQTLGHLLRDGPALSVDSDELVRKGDVRHVLRVGEDLRRISDCDCDAGWQFGDPLQVGETDEGGAGFMCETCDVFG